MPVQDIYWWYVTEFSGSGTWTLDFNVAEQTIYASAALSNVETANGSVWCGVWALMVNEGGNAVPVYPEHKDSNGVGPSLMADNVIAVAFMYGASNASGSCGFQALGFG